MSLHEFHYYAHKNTHSKAQDNVNWNTVHSNGNPSKSIWSLPIQAIIQAAFFSLIIRRSTVACSCFITRQRFHIHIDICDREGD